MRRAEDHARPVASQCLGGRETKAAAATGHEIDPAAQSERRARRSRDHPDWLPRTNTPPSVAIIPIRRPWVLDSGGPQMPLYLHAFHHVRSVSQEIRRLAGAELKLGQLLVVGPKPPFHRFHDVGGAARRDP